MKNRHVIPDRNYWVLEILEYSHKYGIDSGVSGKLKMEKLSAEVREGLIEQGYEKPWKLIRNFRGPTGPGLSRLMLSFQILGLSELEYMKNQGIKYILTERGMKVKRGFDKFLYTINPDIFEVKNQIQENVLKKWINKTGNEIVESSETVKMMKKENLGKQL